MITRTGKQEFNQVIMYKNTAWSIIINGDRYEDRLVLIRKAVWALCFFVVVGRYFDSYEEYMHHEISSFQSMHFTETKCTIISRNKVDRRIRENNEIWIFISINSASMAFQWSDYLIGHFNYTFTTQLVYRIK